MLTVYKASAGAGKTHKLTGEYLLLLFTQPGAYKRILAVTFTNKATDEMKNRIVEELYNLASGNKSDYVSLLMSANSLTEKQVRQQARRILILILHDYSAFNISTIDRFFQQTMRAFTREIGLQGGYGIEMDQELVLAESVDKLLADLEKPESKELLGWLLRFAEEKIENGGEWNLRRDIMALSREVFKESYKAFSDEVSRDIEDKDALEEYKNDLYAIIRSVEREAKRLGEKGMALLKQYGLQPSDFKGGSRSPLFFFEKLANGEMKEPSATFMGLADNLDGCFTKTTSQSLRLVIGCAFEGGLNECIKGVVSLFSDLTAYNTAKEVVRFYYTLGILTDVSRQIAAYREDKNVMLIADTTELLNKIIDGSDAPFIYEKTGTHVDHYMIDEFQDTSGMQWNNFRPLIQESMAHRYANLIVGDVKQSIYRFRNSDWKLLDEQVQNDFIHEEIKEDTLKENWRSCRHIVEVNNALFSVTPALLQHYYNEALDASSLKTEERIGYFTKIMSAYKKSYQQIPAPFQKKDGHVKIEFLTGEDDKDWKEEALERLPGVLEQLQDNGYTLKDIAILVRTNMEGAMVADTLLSYKEMHSSEQYRYDIISDDALYVSSSPVVRFLVATLRYLKNPEDLTNEQIATFSYIVLSGGWQKDAELVSSFSIPADIKQELLGLSRQSLYEITEGLFRLFAERFPDNEQVFVQAFLDMVSEYSQKESPDLNRFLKWWDETGYKKTIATPDEQNAIRILTVHKSKGLGFKVVIIPFGDWEIDHKPSKPVILWCHPDKRPFDRLHLVPVRYGQALGSTIFAKDYFKERLHAFIDNLNTLYVAFTRAKEELLVFAPRPKKMDEKSGDIEKITSIGDLLWAGLNTQVDDVEEGEPLINLPYSFNIADGVFELGNWWHPSEEQNKKMGVEEISMDRIRSVSSDDRLQLRLHGKGFFFDNERRKHGALMHEVLSGIRTEKDIPVAVENYRLAGVVNRDEAEKLCVRLSDLLNQPEVAPWYDGSSRVLNEVDILFGKGLSKRPDRVMINGNEAVVVDYKFGEKQEKRHYSQVKNYLKLIRQMGYEKVSGFLWYVELNRVEAVNEL
ncbi:UvrD-helicase domain-containing protein [Parabacteroides chinchillae]|uniref:DNA 3'-5' helicase n=1 Tax=Parabacteroides chinchillae TaxID=871327 RepID=A0A8G2F551_9BACT|nr:UvrD-helicase domain-containing protein [Parabacteroides chinchillae]SEG14031.1 ATP-dependent exoDNAse (exonuclease V) beta subunit (contains helicase and exonuclease domains) [Parabacteroides chinchillae]